MNILVTGGAGFIGSHIVDKLIDNEHNVIVVDNLSTGTINNVNKSANFIQGSIIDREFIESIISKYKPDCVIHHAAQIDVQRSIEDPTFDCDTNIRGTLNILNSCVKNNVSKIIYASSAAVYGNPNYLPIDENHSINPMSYYGISKFTPEMYIKVYSNMFDIKYTIFRYSNVYGPRQVSKGEGGVVSIFIDKMLMNQSPYIYGDGQQTRDFIYVKDIANANLLALSSADNCILNISSSTRVSINELFEYIRKLIGNNIGAIYKEKRKGDILHSVLDNNKAKECLRWAPQYDLLKGLEETACWFKQQMINKITF